MLQLLWTRENPDAEDRKGGWGQVNINLGPGSYQFNFASFYSDSSDLGDKGLDDILVRAGACSAQPGDFHFLLII